MFSNLKDSSYITAGKSKLGLTIEGAIKTVRESGKYANVKSGTVVKEITDAINMVLGSNVTLKLEPGLSQNANVQVPFINKNNVMWQQIVRDWYSDYLEKDAFDDVYRATNGKLVGGMDSTGKLYGYYSKIPTTITISYDLVYRNNRWKVNDEEATAIILHEIGHFVSFLLSMGWLAKTNYIAYQTHNRLMGVGSIDERAEIIKGICDKEQLNIADDINYLAKCNDPKTTTAVLVGGITTQMRHELGADAYDARGFEAISDNFAAQQGYGLAIVTGLDKMPSANRNKVGTTEHLMAAVLTTVARFAVLFVAPVPGMAVALAAVILHDPASRIYDPKRERYARIKRELVVMLKGAPSKEAKAILTQIETIDKIIGEYSGEYGFVEIFHEAIMPSGRRTKSLRELNQALEELAANKLYVMASKFKALGE